MPTEEMGEEMGSGEPAVPVRPERGADGRFVKGWAGGPGRGGRAVVPDGGAVTAGLMQKVLGQGESNDAGPTEKELRRWLVKDPKGYLQEVERRAAAERVSGGLGGGVGAGPDAGAERVRVLIAELRARLGSGPRPS